MRFKPNPRRKWNTQELASPSDWIAALIATQFGSGLSPVAPGTMGTILAFPLALYLSTLPLQNSLFILTLMTLGGVWAAARLEKKMGSSDNPIIVIDEGIGMGIAALTCLGDWRTGLVAFLLFRFFDVTKLPPVRQVDEWSKVQSRRAVGKLPRFWGAFGVIADDILAGVQALVVCYLLQRFHFLP